MVVIIGIFLTIFALVWGVYWLFGEREDSRTRERLARQLGGVEQLARVGGRSRSPLLIEEARLSDVKLFDTLLSRVTAVSTRLQPFLESADVEITVGRFLLNSLLLGAGTCVVLQWRFGLLTVSAIGALVDVEQPGWGPLRSVAPVWRFAASPVSVHRGAPALGADTAEVLRRLGAGPDRPTG